MEKSPHTIPNTNPEKAISPVDDSTEWTAIINKLLDELQGEELPEKVVEATELLLSGHPIYKVAKKLKVSTETVRRWLSTYPTMTSVLADGRRLLSQWRMNRLEQQFLSAVERSQEVLDVSLDGKLDEDKNVDPKILTVVAAQARYIIGLFAGQRVDVAVKHELGDTVMKAHQDAIRYLADRLAAQLAAAPLEPIETTYRIIDAKLDTSGPLLDETGNPPFGVMGELDQNERGTLCHICGKRFKSFLKHVINVHNTTTQEYELTYMLTDGSIHKVEQT